MMIAEKGDLDRPALSTAARVRLRLDPGQIADLDSEEGRSINLTCGESAQTLRVEVDDRNRLIELQSLMSYDDFRRRTLGELAAIVGSSSRGALAGMSREIRVLGLQPVAALPAPIEAGRPLRHDALEAELADLS